MGTPPNGGECAAEVVGGRNWGECATDGASGIATVQFCSRVVLTHWEKPDDK
jgi:hypothetical protein